MVSSTCWLPPLTSKTTRSVIVSNSCAQRVFRGTPPEGDAIEAVPWGRGSHVRVSTVTWISWVFFQGTWSQRHVCPMATLVFSSEATSPEVEHLNLTAFHRWFIQTLIGEAGIVLRLPIPVRGSRNCSIGQWSLCNRFSANISWYVRVNGFTYTPKERKHAEFIHPILFSTWDERKTLPFKNHLSDLTWDEMGNQIHTCQEIVNNVPLIYRTLPHNQRISWHRHTYYF